ncbi:hypothetical protein DFH09DRAFT_1086099 [Mycena vulgaris]|nr:hypothetical protein DFH09DRAFT_1086099 [Mycena vulgaris]
MQQEFGLETLDLSEDQLSPDSTVFIGMKRRKEGRKGERIPNHSKVSYLEVQLHAQLSTKLEHGIVRKRKLDVKSCSDHDLTSNFDSKVMVHLPPTNFMESPSFPEGKRDRFGVLNCAPSWAKLDGE